MTGGRAAAAVLAVLALASCEKAKPPVCPGEPIGTFTFTGEAVPAADGCPGGGAGALTFTATLAYGSEGEAWLCPQRQEAQAMPGVRSGDHLALAGPEALANVPSCACAVGVTESVEGDVAWTEGVATSFTGELRDALAPLATDAGAVRCEPDAGTADAGPSCGVPCQLRWRLTGRR